jgi:hypothetical protein
MNAESGSPESENLERLRRIKALLGVPTSVPMPPGGGPPSQLVFRSRIDEQDRQYGDIAIAIRKVRAPAIVPPGHQADPRVEWVDLVADVPAPDASSAIVNLSRIVEPMLDVMSFEMGTALGLGQTEVLDITPPLVAGEQREIMVPRDRIELSTPGFSDLCSTN